LAAASFSFRLIDAEGAGAAAGAPSKAEVMEVKDGAVATLEEAAATAEDFEAAAATSVKPAAGWENVGSEAGGAELAAVLAAASFSFRLIDAEGAGAAAGAPSKAEVMEVKDGAVATLEEAAATAEDFEAAAATSVKPAAGWENVGSEAGGAELAAVLAAASFSFRLIDAEGAGAAAGAPSKAEVMEVKDGAVATLEEAAATAEDFEAAAATSVKPAAGWENVGSEAGGAELAAVLAAASFSFRLIDAEGAGAAAGAPSKAEVMEVKDGAVATLEEAAATAEDFEAAAATSVKPAAGWENVGSEAGGAELAAVLAAASFSFRLIDAEGAGAAAGAPSKAEVMEVKDGAVATLEEAAATAEDFEAAAATSVKPAAGWENVGSEAGGAELAAVLAAASFSFRLIDAEGAGAAAGAPSKAEVMEVKDGAVATLEEAAATAEDFEAAAATSVKPAAGWENVGSEAGGAELAAVLAAASFSFRLIDAEGAGAAAGAPSKAEVMEVKDGAVATLEEAAATAEDFEAAAATSVKPAAGWENVGSEAGGAELTSEGTMPLTSAFDVCFCNMNSSVLIGFGSFALMSCSFRGVSFASTGARATYSVSEMGLYPSLPPIATSIPLHSVRV
jgi:hypothetical protein